MDPMDMTVVTDSERERLQAELDQLREEIKRVQERLEERPDYDLGEGDPAIYEWEFNWALLKRLQARAQSLEETLERLAEGSYGRCEQCGGPIHPERLRILPETKLCVECARAK